MPHAIETLTYFKRKRLIATTTYCQPTPPISPVSKGAVCFQHSVSISIARFFLGHSYSLTMILTMISSSILLAAILGLAIFRYYARASRRSQLAKDSSYSVSRYWRRQLPSTSFDSSTPHPASRTLQQTTTETDESTRIIKSSFSWPEASLLHQQQPEKGESSSTFSSSSSLSNSSTMEQLVEPASFTFSLRWNESTDSLFIRVISARNLLLPRRQRSSNLFDSYVRIELLATGENGNRSISFFLS